VPETCRLLLIHQPVLTTEFVRLLGSGQFECRQVAWAAAQREALTIRGERVVVTLPDRTDTGVLRFVEWLREHPLPVPNLMILPPEPCGSVVGLAGEVSEDLLLEPLRRTELLYRVLRLAGQSASNMEGIQTRLIRRLSMEQLIGSEPSFLAAISIIPRAAESAFPVVITGETGTGKEICARAIHHLSNRRNYPFVAVDCSSVPDHLFENEVFGHARGAYTDAHTEHKGLIAMAEGGTLFLDEIDALSLAGQAKLLRFLQERTYRPLGSERLCTADVQVLAASNQSLEAAVRERRFRSDLYYRLSVVRIHLPPLRERPGDIAVLAEHFLRGCAAQGTTYKPLAPAALLKLKLYHWPGNVRELSNTLQRALWFSRGPLILPHDIVLPSSVHEVSAVGKTFHQARSEVITNFERAYVEGLLHQHEGNVTRAALAAGKERRAFGRLVKKYRIQRQAS
jgi:two-component system, NtrC family, response regulator GlrR